VDCYNADIGSDVVRQLELTNLYVWRDTPTLRLLGSFASTIVIADSAVILVDPSRDMETMRLADELARDYPTARVFDFIWPKEPNAYDMAWHFGRNQCHGNWIFDVRPEETWDARLIARIGAEWRTWAQQGYECVELQQSQSTARLRRLFKNCLCECVIPLKLDHSLTISPSWGCS